MGKGKGGGSNTSTQQSTTQVTLPPFIKEAGKDIVSGAKEVGREAYIPYPAPRRAPFSPDQLASFDMTRKGIGAWAPFLGAATQTLGAPQISAADLVAYGASPTSGDAVDEYMNPFTRNVVDVAKREAVRQDDIARLGRNDRAVSAGAFGGDRQGIVEAEAGRNLQRLLSDIEVTGQSAAYDQALKQAASDRARALKAGGLASQTAEQLGQIGRLGSLLNYTDIAALEGVGQKIRGEGQANLDLAYSDFLRQYGLPEQRLSLLSSLLSNTPHGRTQTTDTTTSGPSPNQGGGILGSALQALGWMMRPIHW